MGENEQSGMLRTVVVLGIIALITGIVIYTVLKLKDSMNENIDSGIPPVLVINALEPDQMTSYMNTFDGKDWSNIQRTDIEPGVITIKDNMNVVLDTRNVSANKWALVRSPMYAVPDDAKRVKLSITVKGGGPKYVHPWIHFYDKDGHDIQSSTAGSFYIDAINNKTLDDFTTMTKVGQVPDNAVKMCVSMETREKMLVEYKDVTATVYQW